MQIEDVEYNCLGMITFNRFKDQFVHFLSIEFDQRLVSLPYWAEVFI